MSRARGSVSRPRYKKIAVMFRNSKCHGRDYTYRARDLDENNFRKTDLSGQRITGATERVADASVNKLIFLKTESFKRKWQGRGRDLLGHTRDLSMKTHF